MPNYAPHYSEWNNSDPVFLCESRELFGSVLINDHIDQEWPVEQQLNAFFDSDASHFAITQDRKYSTLVSKLTMLNELLRTMIGKK